MAFVADSSHERSSKSYRSRINPSLAPTVGSLGPQLTFLFLSFLMIIAVSLRQQSPRWYSKLDRKLILIMCGNYLALMDAAAAGKSAVSKLSCAESLVVAEVSIEYWSVWGDPKVC